MFYWDASARSCTVDTFLLHSQSASLHEFHVTLEVVPNQTYRLVVTPTHLGLTFTMYLPALTAKLEVGLEVGLHDLKGLFQPS